MQLVIIIAVAMAAQANAMTNNTTTLSQSGNQTVQIDTTKGTFSNFWDFSFGVKWLNYVLNAIVFVAGCFGNFIVIYVLGFQKAKV